MISPITQKNRLGMTRSNREFFAQKMWSNITIERKVKNVFGCTYSHNSLHASVPSFLSSTNFILADTNVHISKI